MTIRRVVRLACRHHRERRSQRALGAEAGPSPSASHAQAQPPSLLLIFAESLEATFSRKDIFSEDLTPQLTALAASGKQFTDMRQVSLTAWTTTGAMVAAECASPLAAGGQWQDLLRNIATGVSPEMEGTTCLGDVLAAHGYHTVLMAGADVNFGGKGTFHASHGFVERLGFNALKARRAPPLNRRGASPWRSVQASPCRHRGSPLPFGKTLTPAG